LQETGYKIFDGKTLNNTMSSTCRLYLIVILHVAP